MVLLGMSKNTTKKRLMAAFSSETPRYGSALGVPLAKSLEEVVMEQRSWKKGDFHQQKDAGKGRNREDQ